MFTLIPAFNFSTAAEIRKVNVSVLPSKCARLLLLISLRVQYVDTAVCEGQVRRRTAATVVCHPSRTQVELRVAAGSRPIQFVPTYCVVDCVMYVPGH